MPTVKISKLKVRRGSDTQRKFVVFDQGELVYTLDNKRLFVGSGTLNGESVVGSKIHPPISNYYSLSTVNSEIGDLINVNNKYYQLTAFNYNDINSWADVSAKIDNTVFSYDSSNKLTLKTNSISASYIDPLTVSNGVKISNGILQSKFNTKSLELSAYELSLKIGGIDEREINASTLGYGLSGGSGDKIGIKADPYYFYNSSSNTLSLSTDNLPKYDLTFDKLSSSWFGGGLNYNTGLQRIQIDPSFFGYGLKYNPTTQSLSSDLVGVDEISLTKNLSGQVSIKRDALSGTNQWGSLTIDSFGRVTTNSSSIYGALTGISGIYKGVPSQSLSGIPPSLSSTITKVDTLSSNGTSSVTITLSSAGFITFEGPSTTTRDGSTVGRFAIPIFSY